MATKSLYLMGGALLNGFQPMQDGGAAPADAAFATATGWIIGTTAAGNYAGFRANTERATTAFTATVEPDTEGLVTGATGNAFRTGPYTGTFAAGDWTLSAILRSVTAAMGSAQTGTLRWRVFASLNADGTGARELTTGVAESNTVAGTGNTTANQAARSATWTAPAVVLGGEYLFFVNAFRMVAAGGTGATRDANFRQNSSSVITTTDFVPGISRTIGDTLGLTESLTRTRQRSTSDNLGISDPITRGIQRVMSESLGLLDSTSPVKGRIMGDSLGLLDSIATRALSRSLSADLLGLSDSYSQVRSRAAMDLLGLSESMSRAFTRPVSESLALTDLVASGRGRALSDVLGLSDEVVPSGTGRITRIVSDTVGIGDSYSSSIAVVRNVTDPLGLADAISAQRGISVLIADSLGITDNAIQRTGLGVVVADSLSLLDEVTPVRKIERVATDTLGLVDSYVVPGGVIIVDRMSQIVGFATLPAFGVAQVRLLPGVEASVEVIAAMIARGEIIG